MVRKQLLNSWIVLGDSEFVIISLTQNEPLCQRKWEETVDFINYFVRLNLKFRFEEKIQSFFVIFLSSYIIVLCTSALFKDSLSLFFFIKIFFFAANLATGYHVIWTVNGIHTLWEAFPKKRQVLTQILKVWANGSLGLRTLTAKFDLQEYLSLAAGEKENYSEVYGQRLITPNSCPHNGSRPRSVATAFCPLNIKIQIRTENPLKYKKARLIV